MAITISKNPAPLCACRLALVLGMVWGVSLLLLGIVTLFTENYGHEVVKLIGNVYYGYSPGSFAGAFIGMLWGFADGFIGVLIIAGLYNWLCKTGKCCCAGKETCCETPEEK